MNNNEINDKILALHDGWIKLPESRPELDIYVNTDGTMAARSYDLPDYTENMACAWDLVLEMYDAGFSVNITVMPTICPPFICDAHDSREEFGPPEEFKAFVEDGETAEIAICKLYLKWKEVMQ